MSPLAVDAHVRPRAELELRSSNFCFRAPVAPQPARQLFIYVSGAVRAIERKLNVARCGPTNTIIAQSVWRLQFAVETTRCY